MQRREFTFLVLTFLTGVIFLVSCGGGGVLPLQKFNLTVETLPIDPQGSREETGYGGQVRIGTGEWGVNRTVTADSGTEHVIEAKAGEGFELEGWYREVTRITGNATHMVTMNGNQNYRAQFSANPVPQFSSPVPGNLSQKIPNDVEFSWEFDQKRGEVFGYHFYFGTDPDQLEKKNLELLTNSSFKVEGIDYNTTFYWKVGALVEGDDHQEEVQSPIWSFTTSNTLEIHVVASQEDMENGHFFIEFYEKKALPADRTFQFVNQDHTTNNHLSNYVEIIQSEGYLEGEIREATFEMSFDSSVVGKVKYGYRVVPQPNTASNLGTGYCDANIGLWDVISTFPFLQSEERGWDEVLVFFDVSSVMPVYTPWEEIDEKKRIFRLHPYDQYLDYLHENRFWLCAWGNFDSVFQTDQDWKNLVILGYQTDTAIVADLIIQMYNHLMTAFENTPKLLPKRTIFVIFPENDNSSWRYYTTSEGMGGFYLPNNCGQETEPVVNQDLRYSYEYDPTPPIHSNLGGLATTAGHCLTHSVITNFLGWWAVEGIATYYQMYLFRLAEWLSEEMYEEEWKYYINIYWDEIVAEGKDLPLAQAGEYQSGDGALETWMAYKKSALVFFIYDQIIRKTTNNEYELIDFFKYWNEKLYNEYKDEPYNRTSYYFNQSLSEFTGLDMFVFFEEFIEGTNPLPIRIVEDRIVIEQWEPPMIEVHGGNLIMGDESCIPPNS